MISVDQIYLLQKKVESAVQKIEQLKSENDALRTKCSELTNALSEKTELLSSFTADEKKIEDGIMNALNRLDSVENSLLDNAGSKAAVQSAPVAVSVNAPAPSEKPAQPVQVTVNVQTAPATSEPTIVEQPDQSDEGESDLFGDTTFATTEDETKPDIY